MKRITVTMTLTWEEEDDLANYDRAMDSAEAYADSIRMSEARPIVIVVGADIQPIEMQPA